MARTAGVVSALLLACLSFYCFVQYFQLSGDKPTFALVTFAVSALYGTLIGLDEVADFGGNYRKHVNVLEDTLVLPFFAAEIWLKVGIIPTEAACFHAIVAVIPMICHFLNKSIKEDFLDALQLISVVSILTAGVLSSSYYAIGAAAAYGVARFSFRKGNNCMDFDCTDMYNYALCGFITLALMAIKGCLK